MTTLITYLDNLHSNQAATIPQSQTVITQTKKF